MPLIHATDADLRLLSCTYQIEVVVVWNRRETTRLQTVCHQLALNAQRTRHFTSIPEAWRPALELYCNRLR